MATRVNTYLYTMANYDIGLVQTGVTYIISLLRTALFCVIKQRAVVLSYRRFETTYRTQSWGPRIEDARILEP
jgi:hypothetical protein